MSPTEVKRSRDKDRESSSHKSRSDRKYKEPSSSKKKRRRSSSSDYRRSSSSKVERKKAKIQKESNGSEGQPTEKSRYHESSRSRHSHKRDSSPRRSDSRSPKNGTKKGSRSDRRDKDKDKRRPRRSTSRSKKDHHKRNKRKSSRHYYSSSSTSSSPSSSLERTKMSSLMSSKMSSIMPATKAMSITQNAMSSNFVHTQVAYQQGVSTSTQFQQTGAAATSQQFSQMQPYPYAQFGFQSVPPGYPPIAHQYPVPPPQFQFLNRPPPVPPPPGVAVPSGSISLATAPPPPPPTAPPPPTVAQPPPPPPPPMGAGDSILRLPMPVPPPSTSQQRQPQLPMPKHPVFGRPTIMNKRKLPQVAENWGMGNYEDYATIEIVGEGTYGQVYKARCKKSGQLVALKRVRLENERDGFPITAIREVKILRQLDHKNVVKLINIVTDKRKAIKATKDPGAFYLVFEYVDHDLNGLLESGWVNFNDQQIASMFKQLLLGLEHCHSLNFLHRDIKCSNILVNNKGQIKLADFGLARLYQKEYERLYTNRVITLWYRPPELLLGKENYGPAVDIWSIGCILGELFAKKPIFQGRDEMEQIIAIYKCCGTPTRDNWPEAEELSLFENFRVKNFYPRVLKNKFSFISAQPLDLLDKLLQLDPTRRPSASEALNHPWIAHLDPEKIPAPALPTHQDCHEMWSKKQRQARQQQVTQHPPPTGNSNSAVAAIQQAQASTSAPMPQLYRR